MKGAIADHGGRRADHAEEALDDASRSSFLPEAEKSADEDDCEDDRAVHALTDDERQNGGDEQQDRDRAGELCRQEPYRVCMPTGSGQVGSVLGESVSVGLRLSPAHLLSSGAPPEPLRWARPTMRLRGRRSRQAPERSGRCGWAGRRAGPSLGGRSGVPTADELWAREGMDYASPSCLERPRSDVVRWHPATARERFRPPLDAEQHPARHDERRRVD